MRTIINKIIEKFNRNEARLMDILLDVQAEFGLISGDAVTLIAEGLNISSVDVQQTISFYHFFSQKSRGKYTIYLNDSAVAYMMGRADIARTFEEECKCKFGSVTEDGQIGLFNTACIGMNDQEPAAIINGIVFPKLTESCVKDIVNGMKEGKSVPEMMGELGDGENSNKLLNSMVNNNIMKTGSVLFSDYKNGTAINKLVTMTPKEVIGEVKASHIRGLGGAGFPTGMKWDFCSMAEGDERFVLCNADEGEPGTFKDRVILTELPNLIFEGMTIAAYAIGAKEGILYLRQEYHYMKAYLESVLDKLREENYLGKDIAGKIGFNFDIRIQFGAGAYVCGEESALIESCEGKRGEPRNRPPFPVQKGYLQKPTVINNVETLCSVVKIIENGGEWFSMMGTKETAGTKLLSISGDCKYPGVYEVEWGIRIRDMLEMVGGEEAYAVQVSGPSGICISKKDFKRTICFEDLPSGGSIIIIGKERNLIKDIVCNFMDFFIDESCGSCVPCRSLPLILKNKLQKLLDGNGVMSDLTDLENWSKNMKAANRCGLGQTAANPILSTLKNFREDYEALIKNKEKDFDTGFNLDAAVAASCEAVGRNPQI
ncbi:MAG: NAD(P)H-dependent oxidoreductase subunit E [Bacteroidales bacterium]|nr:NAD(P)H-dependent oxidoreductase subunit E [Bacteroidales bacterium]